MLSDSDNDFRDELSAAESNRQNMFILEIGAFVTSDRV